MTAAPSALSEANGSRWILHRAGCRTRGQSGICWVEKTRAIRLMNRKHHGESGVSLSFTRLGSSGFHPSAPIILNYLPRTIVQLINQTYYINPLHSVFLSHVLSPDMHKNRSVQCKTEVCNAHPTTCLLIFTNIQHPEYPRTAPENG